MNNENTEKNFSIIPDELMEYKDKGLNSDDILLYGKIKRLCNNEEKKCWALNKYFIDFMRSSRRSIQYSLKKLEKLKLIKMKINYEHGTKHVISRFIYLLPIHNTNIKNTNETDSIKKVKEKSEAENLFLQYWKQNPDIFNITASIGNKKRWSEFWDTSPPTPEYVELAMKNFITDIREGFIERKFIPSTPDRFIKGNWLNTCQKRQNENRHRIASDNITAGMKWWRDIEEIENPAVVDRTPMLKGAKTLKEQQAEFLEKGYIYDPDPDWDGES